jgi:hypothetical protein
MTKTNGVSRSAYRPASSQKLCGFFVEADNFYGPFATYEKAVAFARTVYGEVCQLDLNRVSSCEMTREEYEREFAHRPHLITPTEQN